MGGGFPNLLNIYTSPSTVDRRKWVGISPPDVFGCPTIQGRLETFRRALRFCGIHTGAGAGHPGEVKDLGGSKWCVGQFFGRNDVISFFLNLWFLDVPNIRKTWLSKLRTSGLPTIARWINLVKESGMSKIEWIQEWARNLLTLHHLEDQTVPKCTARLYSFQRFQPFLSNINRESLGILCYFATLLPLVYKIIFIRSTGSY